MEIRYEREISGGNSPTQQSTEASREASNAPANEGRAKESTAKENVTVLRKQFKADLEAAQRQVRQANQAVALQKKEITTLEGRVAELESKLQAATLAKEQAQAATSISTSAPLQRKRSARKSEVAIQDREVEIDPQAASAKPPLSAQTPKVVRTAASRQSRDNSESGATNETKKDRGDSAIDKLRNERDHLQEGARPAVVSLPERA